VKLARLAIGAFLVLSLGATKIATSAILCKTTDSTLKLRDTVCQKKEIRIDPASLGLQGPQGPPGPQGARGVQGIQGSPGPLPKMTAVIRSASTVFTIGGLYRVDCLPGEIAVGGGIGPNWAPSHDMPLFNGEIWSWGIDAPSSLPSAPPFTLAIHVVCVSLQP
jgi:hypothetical protein